MNDGAANDVAILEDAWKYFRDAAEDARLAMEATPRFRTRADHRAAAYASLLEAQAMAHSIAAAPRMDHPIINTRSWYHNAHTLGGTSVDLYHVTALVDGQHTYRLFGRIGDVKSLVMQSFNKVWCGSGHKQTMEVDLRSFATADGRFEAIVSAEPQAGNWIRIDPTSRANLLFIRRFYDDWHGDRGELDIELLDGPIDHDDFSAAATAERIRRAADLLTFLIKAWNIRIYDIYLESNQGRKNSIAVVPGTAIASDMAGSPQTIYSWGVFDIQPDEALLIESDVVDAGFWSLQIQDAWTRPINYIDHQSDINQRNAAIDADGKFRAVICLRDPGIANWLDPAGHLEGTIVGRAYHARATPSTPKVRLIEASDLAKHLPAGTRRVTPDERRAALKHRRQGILRLFGDL